MGYTVRATEWFGVCQEEDVSPWHSDVVDQDGFVLDEHIEYINEIGLYVVEFGNSIFGPEMMGLCLPENQLTLSDRVGPLIVQQTQHKHIPWPQWLELLEKARWVGPKEPRVYLSLHLT